MSMKLASIEVIAEVFPHPNADSLEFVKVLGYNCIVPKDTWTKGDLCVFIQPDSVLPDTGWAQVYKSKSNRVKAIKLRGEYSFGIVEKCENLFTLEGLLMATAPLSKESADVTELLGITKYEPPASNEPGDMGGLPFGIVKTDEERFQNLDMPKYYGQIVDISLKVDGQSFTCYYNEGQFGVTGRSREQDLACDNRFTQNMVKYGLQEKLTQYCEKYGVNIALRGEQYGSGVQNLKTNPHSKMPPGLVFFSCWDIDAMSYFGPDDTHYYRDVCAELDLPVVPLLQDQVVLTKEIVDTYQNATELNEEPFEGVVIVGEGFSFKVINLHYDSKK